MEKERAESGRRKQAKCGREKIESELVTEKVREDHAWGEEVETEVLKTITAGIPFYAEEYPKSAPASISNGAEKIPGVWVYRTEENCYEFVETVAARWERLQAGREKEGSATPHEPEPFTTVTFTFQARVKGQKRKAELTGIPRIPERVSDRDNSRLTLAADNGDRARASEKGGWSAEETRRRRSGHKIFYRVLEDSGDESSTSTYVFR